MFGDKKIMHMTNICIVAASTNQMRRRLERTEDMSIVFRSRAGTVRILHRKMTYLYSLESTIQY